MLDNPDTPFQKITPQSVFNAAYKAFILDDKPPSVSPEGGCMYLNPEGRKCVIGLVLPDGHPAQKHKGWVDGLMHSFPELFESSYDVYIMKNLQGILHDDRIEKGEWRESLEERKSIYINFAKRHNLEIPNG